jgi:hypothetical protein
MKTRIIWDETPGSLTYASKLPLWYRHQFFLRQYALKADIFNVHTRSRYIKLMTQNVTDESRQGWCVSYDAAFGCLDNSSYFECECVRVETAWPLQMWPTGCPEKPVNNRQNMLSNNQDRKYTTCSTFITVRKNETACETYVYMGE